VIAIEEQNTNNRSAFRVFVGDKVVNRDYEPDLFQTVAEEVFNAKNAKSEVVDPNTPEAYGPKR